MSTQESGADLAWLNERYAALRDSVGAVVVGQEEAVRLCFATLLCGGHSLIEGPPGVAKTLLVRVLSATLGVRFGRIQFTPDLMPSDVIGGAILTADRRSFEFRPGPIFTDMLLADEINRAPAKTQAALLEAMQERAVTVDGERHDLGPLFSVFATQNPIEQEGTYPLPEAELDRFLFKIDVGYPSEEDELRVLQVHHVADPDEGALPVVMQPDDVQRARRTAAALVVQDDVMRYLRDLVRATRVDPQIAVGGSPRAALWLLRAAKAAAALDGRDFVLPQDVQDVWLPVLRHRVVLEPSAEVQGETADDVLGDVLRGLAAPH